MIRTASSVAPLVLRAETAADLMAPNPISLRAEAKVAEAIALFTEKGIAAAPVIDDAGRPIGVLSRSDVLVHHCEHHRHGERKPEYFFAGSDAEQDVRPTGGLTVADLMTPAVFAVAPDTPVHRVVSDMVGLHVHRLFVVDDAGVLIGVISAMDVLRHLEPEE
ncbi:MAG: CBS domain-containing protein [Planctomycetes bacterium]|nr:CBS domain-containing protein [Planctomycetota bacterium]